MGQRNQRTKPVWFDQFCQWCQRPWMEEAKRWLYDILYAIERFYRLRIGK